MSDHVMGLGDKTIKDLKVSLLTLNTGPLIWLKLVLTHWLDQRNSGYYRDTRYSVKVIHRLYTIHPQDIHSLF